MFLREDTKTIVGTVAYLIGVRKETWEDVISAAAERDIVASAAEVHRTMLTRSRKRL